MKNNESFFADMITLILFMTIFTELAGNSNSDKQCTEKKCKCKGNSFSETLKNGINIEGYSLLPNSKKEEMLKDLDRVIELLDKGFLYLTDRAEIATALHKIKDKLSQVE